MIPSQNTVNSRLADTPLLRTLAITDKIKIPIYRGLTGNDSRYYGLSLFRTQNDVSKVSAIMRVDCMNNGVSISPRSCLVPSEVRAHNPSPRPSFDLLKTLLKMPCVLLGYNFVTNCTVRVMEAWVCQQNRWKSHITEIAVVISMLALVALMWAQP